MKVPYSEPKIFTGGVNILNWSKLTKAEQSMALTKEWFLYYSYRDPKTGKLKREPHIKAGVNKYKTKKERIFILKKLQRNLSMLLERGFNPYESNDVLGNKFFGNDSTQVKGVKSNTKIEVAPTPKFETPIIPKKITKKQTSETESDVLSVSDALKFGLEIKKKELSRNSYRGYVSHINRFEKWLIENQRNKLPISSITKKNVIDYLNSILLRSSSRNRNNTRASISSLFKTLEDNEIIRENFVRKINVLKTTPKRNKTYSPKQEKEITEYLKENDPILLLFIQFLSYNFLRPIEVCRLKIGDLDIEDKKLTVKAKNKVVKIKIIPDLLIELLPDLSEMDKNHFLFSFDGIGGAWDIDDNNKRDHFSKRFKKAKDHFGLGIDYGLYSYRHTTITKLYREMRKNASPFEAKTKLMVITGHTTMVALEQYLRDIDAELPEDYSKLLKN